MYDKTVKHQVKILCCESSNQNFKNVLKTISVKKSFCKFGDEGWKIVFFSVLFLVHKGHNKLQYITPVYELI